MSIDGSRLYTVWYRILTNVLVCILLCTSFIAGQHRQIEVFILESRCKDQFQTRAHLELIRLGIRDEIIVVVGIAAVREATRHIGRLRISIDIKIDAAIECQAGLSVFCAEQLVLDIEVRYDAVGLFLLP